MIDRLTNNSSRELSHHRFLTCHKSKIRSAESERKSERLSFSDCHVCPVFCRSLDYSQRNRIHSHHIFGSCLMCDLADLFCVFQITVIVRMLDIDTCCLLVYIFFQIIQICHAVFFRNLHDLHSISMTIRMYRCQCIRQDCCGYEGFLTLSLLAHCHTFCCRLGTVIHTGIGHVHSGQITDHCLILENGL